MSEKKALFLINVFKNIINVYFDTFFVFYFFKVANYEALPLAKYYLSLYLFIGIGFFLIRNAMKRNIKVPYFRIGISLQAVYIAMIMLLKDNLINYIYLVGIVKGLADGFYHFPKNILDSEKVTNEGRQKFDGIVNIVNRIVSIVIPLLLGVLLTFFTYVELGKVFFMIFIVMFIVSFWIRDEYHVKKKFEFKKIFKLMKEDKNIRNALFIPFLAGFSYSSGVMGTIMTIAKINNFNSNLYLGYVDSVCAGLALVVSILYLKIHKENFDIWVYISGISIFISLFAFAVVPSMWTFVAYLFIRNSLVKMLEMITSNVSANLSNCKEIKGELKPEYYCMSDIMYSISRCSGYLVLLIVCLVSGMEYINYILFISAGALLLQSVIVGKLCKKY